jgi:hypothetical protein
VKFDEHAYIPPEAAGIMTARTLANSEGRGRQMVHAGYLTEGGAALSAYTRMQEPSAIMTLRETSMVARRRM